MTFPSLFRVNKFFENTGPNLAKDIPDSPVAFERNIKKIKSTMSTSTLTMNEFKDAFSSLKINKSPGYDDMSFNVIRKYFGNLCEPLKYRFDISFQKGVFPNDLKVARVTPIFKSREKAEISNC